MNEEIFQSFLMGGFECSTHRNQGGKRLDLIDSTRHDQLAASDYLRMTEIGMRTARDGARWYLIEREPYQYDFSSLKNQVYAARETGIEIIWDLFHYGYPQDLDIFSPAFPERFARFSAAVTEFLAAELGDKLFICPVNEISFFAWAAGKVGVFYPFKKKRGNELKRQLVRATIESIKAIRSVSSAVRFVFTDPAIHVVAGSARTPALKTAAEKYRRVQFEGFDMICGRRNPELGGRPEYLDIIGLNYYFHNQWRYPSRRKIKLGHAEYRPLSEILQEYYQRYNRPILIAETGIEDEKRPEWFRYVCEQTRVALSNRVPIQGVCLYPVVNHPGWADNRHCHNGLWDYADDWGEREIYEPLAREIAFQNEAFANKLKMTARV
jgi:beta-glucosidase/6-phospho-beta-glucosidase/beta-galactosidase